MMQKHAQIADHLRNGNIDVAMTEIDRRLAASPNDADLLGLKGFALAINNEIDAAQASVRQAVEHAATPAQRLKHAGNLARLLARTGRRKDLADMADVGLVSPGVLSSADVDVVSLENLCEPLLLVERFDFVAELLEPLLDNDAVSWAVERLWLRAATGAGQHDKILNRVDTPDYRWRNEAEVSALAAAAAAALDRKEDCRRLYEAYLAAAPLLVMPRLASQILSIVLISADPDVPSLTLPAIQQHATGNFPSQLIALRPDRYRFFSVFAGSPPRALTAEIGEHERAITLNNCVNAESLKRGELAAVVGHERTLGLPLVNAASGAIHCTRVETADMLRGIDNLVVPKAMRFRLEAGLLPATCRAIAELFAFPVIIRTVGEQEGRNIHLARTAAATDAVLTELLTLGEREIYVIEYVGTEYSGGFFRRIRAAYVEGTPTLIRADHDAQWMVKGRKFARIQNLYRSNKVLFNEAQRLVAEPQRLGDAAWATLTEIGKRIPLDVFGIDFEVDHQGRVVFFECNATMNLLSSAPPEIDYPPEAQEALLGRLDRFFLKRAGLSLH